MLFGWRGTAKAFQHQIGERPACGFADGTEARIADTGARAEVVYSVRADRAVGMQIDLRGDWGLVGLIGRGLCQRQSVLGMQLDIYPITNIMSNIDLSDYDFRRI